MNKIQCIFLCLCVCLLRVSSWAAGTCPTDASHINPANPTGPLVSLATLGATSCYFIAANGSDSNDGLSEASGHPFLRAPGMPNFTGSATIAAGVWLVFRGGDTWHFGSATSPAVGAKSWSYVHSGTSTSVRDGISFDSTWFSGGSFARPIFSGDNTITTSTVASCTFDFNGVNVVSLSTNAHFGIDGFEFSGFCDSATVDQNNGYISGPSGTDSWANSNYFHGMTIKTGYNFDEAAMIHGNGNGWKGDTTNQCLFNVFDNSDGSLGNFSSYPCTACSTFEGVQNGCAVVAYSVFNRLSNGVVGTSTSLHDNLFHDLYEPGGAVHGNIWNSNNDGLVNVGPQSFYNNEFFNIDEGVGVWLMPVPATTGVAYLFNNVGWNVFNSTNCYVLGGAAGIKVYFYQNTDVSACNIRLLNNGSDPVFNGTIFFQNDQFIGFGTPGALSNTFNCDAGATCAEFDNGNELFQSATAASSQNYVAGTQYASRGSTIGTGSNLLNACPLFSADKALCFGRAGVSEVAGLGGQIASYPAAPVLFRGLNGAWNTGAYQQPSVLSAFVSAAKSSSGGASSSAQPAASGSGVIILSEARP